MRVGLAGFGTAGQEVARRLAAGAVPGLHLTAVTARSASISPAGRHPRPCACAGGSAREVAAAFPRHFNVAVALSLAGIGFDRTEIEVFADPEVAGAVHQVEVDAEDIGLTMISRNRPSANPRTSRIVAPSIVAALRAMVAPLVAGG